MGNVDLYPWTGRLRGSLILGEHDVDRDWISEVKATGAKVVPRLIFEKWNPKILKQLLENEKVLIVSISYFKGSNGIWLERP